MKRHGIPFWFCVIDVPVTLAITALCAVLVSSVVLFLFGH